MTQSTAFTKGCVTPKFSRRGEDVAQSNEVQYNVF